MILLERLLDTKVVDGVVLLTHNHAQSVCEVGTLKGITAKTPKITLIKLIHLFDTEELQETSLSLGDLSTFKIIKKTLSSIYAITAGADRALIIHNLPFGVLLTISTYPHTLEESAKIVEDFAKLFY
ncbi:hypothetical protein K7432_005669 [Basidiobolus ranarum]|uniref:Uncharacterized protein n=1 Tax=Basidiobolus ranarum TaxID=34480 RepID=A0ABR2W3A5_9FUNG